MHDPKELRRLMGQFATGVTVITTEGANGAPYGLTANAVTSLWSGVPNIRRLRSHRGDVTATAATAASGGRNSG